MNTADQIENQMTAEPSVSAERQSIGKFLRRFAWAFEIAAVTIGLAISIATMMANFEEMNSYRDDGLNWGDWANIFIAAIPFVMVAMVEITKIPLVGVFYKASSNLWRWVFGLCLLFVAAITFESAFNGFERNFSALMYSIDAPKKEIVTLDQKLEKLTGNRAQLTEMTLESIEAEYNTRYDELFAQTNGQKKEIQSQISDLRASIQTEFVNELRKDQESARKERQRLISEQEKEIARITEDYSSQSSRLASEMDSEKRSLQGQLADAIKRLEEIEKQAAENIEKASIFSGTRVRKEEKEKVDSQKAIVSDLRNRLNSRNTGSSLSNIKAQEREAKENVRANYARLIASQDKKIERLRLDIAKSVSGKEKEIESNINVYQDQLKAIDSEFQTQLLVLQQTRDRNYDRLANNENLVAEIDVSMDELQTRRIDLVQEINEKVAGNQIYRIATWTTNKDSAAEVERDVVGLVAAIWFGSLAAMIALMGVFLALGSYVILDPRQKDRGDKSQRSAFEKFLRSRRAYYNAKRKEVFTRKEIVEVDKVVFKEIPVEVVKKEFVHVPFYTNDPRLLNMSLDASMESEHSKDNESQSTPEDIAQKEQSRD